MQSIVRHRLFDRGHELNEIYWAWSLKSLGLSLISIFLPIYLYSLNYSIPTILFFYLMLNAFRAIFEPASGILVGHYGPKHVMAASFYLLLLQLGMFLTLPTAHWSLVLLAAVSAIGYSLHFISLHTHFSHIKRVKSVGREVGRLTELTNLSSSLGPLVGGLVATFVGIQYSFAAALVLTSFAIFPLFRSRDFSRPTTVPWGHFRLRTIARDLVANIGGGIESSMSTTLWPFALFLVVGTYAKVGAIATLSVVLALITSQLVGRLIDQGFQKQLLVSGGMAEAVLNIFRIFASTPLTVTLVGIVSEVTGGYWLTVPFIAAYYEHADRAARIKYIVAMEMAAQIGKVLFWAALVLASLHSTMLMLVVGFGMSAVAAMLMPLIRPLRKLA